MEIEECFTHTYDVSFGVADNDRNFKAQKREIANFEPVYFSKYRFC